MRPRWPSVRYRGDFARVAQDDHQHRSRDELHHQGLANRLRQCENRDGLEEQQRHCEQPVDVAVALVEALAVDQDVAHGVDRCSFRASVDGHVRALEGLEDPPVVIGRDQRDDG